MILTLNKKRRISFIASLIAVFFIISYVSYMLTSNAAMAVTVAEDCYVFDSATGNITSYNPDSDPACETTSLDVPATIGGVPVTGITGGGLSSMVLTSLTLPSSIEVISGAGIGYGSTLDSLTINAANNLTITPGSVGDVDGEINITAGGDLTIGGLIGAVGDINLQADGNITIGAGSFSSAPDLVNVSITSGGNINLIESFMHGAEVSTLDLVSGGSIHATQGSLGDSSIELVSMDSAGNVLLTQGAFYNTLNLALLDISSEGDLLFDDGTFQNTGLVDLIVSVQGDVTVADGALLDNSLLKKIDITSTSGSIDFFGPEYLPELLEVNLNSINGDVNLDGLYESQALTSITISAGMNATVLEDAVYNNTSLSSLSINGGTGVAINNYTFMYSTFTVLNLPATTTLIGDSAFAESPLDAVYLAGSPTIGEYAFVGAGIIYDADNDTFDLSGIKYVPIYTADPSNPAGLLDKLHTPYDIDGDGTADNAGGYIINPASFTLSYLDSNGNTLLAEKTLVGELNGTSLTDYLVSSNPSGDFSPYYRSGSAYSFAGPSISPFVTPANLTGSSNPGVNQLQFIYNTPVAPNTGAGQPALQPSTITAVVIGGLSILVAIRILRLAYK